MHLAPVLRVLLGATALLALGMNSPYAAVLTLAARYGRRTGIGAASAQGTVILLLCLGLITLPLFIGMGTALGQPFALSGILFGGLALLAAWNLGKPSSQDGSCTTFHALEKYDNRLNVHPPLIPQKEDVDV